METDRPHAHPEHTRLGAVCFRLKAAVFQLQRAWQDFRTPVSRHPRGDALAGRDCAGEWTGTLFHSADDPRERTLLEGKVQNLRLAAAAFNGLEIPAGQTWSFWRQLGRATRRRGFVLGRELREGCIIPAIGGGLCQLSGAIYNAALAAGLEIVERHAHSNREIGLLARMDRDATIFWNYVDLRLRAPVSWRLEVKLSPADLIVRIRTESPLPRQQPAPGVPTAAPEAAPNSCVTCGVESCFRSHPQP